MLNFLKKVFTQPAPAPAPAAAVAAPEPAAAPAKAAVADGNSIQIPLRDIAARLAPPLAPVNAALLAGSYSLPIQNALEQLAGGTVRIHFGTLRHAAPGAFGSDGSHDDALIDLPLAKILAAIPASRLSRRAGQKQMELPDDVSGVFGPEPDKAYRAAVPTISAPAPVAKPAPVPVPQSIPVVPAIAVAPMPTPIPFAPAADAIAVKVSAVYEFWPVEVRQEIAQAGGQDASVALPVDRLDAAMKSGRIVFNWSELRAWMNVSGASPHGQMMLELPLKVVAPLFMARRSGAVQQKKWAVADNIPNIFAEPAKAAPAPQPAPAPIAVAPLSVPVMAMPAAKEQSPQEIIQRINSLPGVAACLVAMNDGLLLAGELPAPFKSETVAAFLPQMFGRLLHYCGEIQLGGLNGVTLQTGDRSCAIFKTGTLYLTVLGKPGETLPDALLRQISVELGNCK